MKHTTLSSTSPLSGEVESRALDGVINSATNSRIDRLTYGVDKVNFIRDKLAGYAGGVAIAGELLQNADDAGAEVVRFYFHPERLDVYNSSSFREQDFQAITDIASGSKRDDEGKIGTWGTGFLSVYHLTDEPQLHSSGKFLRFDPQKNHLDVYSSPFQEGTRFFLPWRRTPSKLSQRMEAQVWTEEDIQRLKEEMITASYAYILFLRTVRTIEIYEGADDEAKLLCQVHRKKIETLPFPQFLRDHWEITYKRAGVREQIDPWLYYRTKIQRTFDIPDIKAKDYEISLAFPLQNRKWLDQHVPGSLYNFLPTPIRTELAFQINAAFFPDNNRKAIVLEEGTHRQKTEWNRRVLQSLAKLFADVLTDIRDQCKEDTRRFYDLLPVRPSSVEYLQVIHEIFAQSAAELEIVWSSQNVWKRPAEVHIGQPGSKLPELAADYMHVLPTGLPQPVRDFLQSRSPSLDWRRVIEFLRPSLREKLPIADAHPMINSRETLSLLYSELPNAIKEDERTQLREIFLWLDTKGSLHSLKSAIWRADAKSRRLLLSHSITLIDDEMEKKYPRLFESLVDPFRGAELVAWLVKRHWPQTPLSSAQVPKELWTDLAHLKKLLHFIADDLERVDRDHLAAIPLVIGEDDDLYRGSDDLHRLEDPSNRTALKPFGFRFAHPEWLQDEKVAAVYGAAGVLPLTPTKAITHLANQGSSWAEQLSSSGIIGRLLPLYEYFYFHRDNLTDKDRQSLREISICLTGQAHLTTAAGVDQQKLFLSTESKSVDSTLAILDKLALDHLIHSELLQNSGRLFLTSILGLHILQPATLVQDVIIPNYLDKRFSDEERKSLLEYIRRQMQDETTSSDQTLWRRLSSAALLLAHDGEYREAEKLYFSSPALDTIFDGQYAQLHAIYALPKADNDSTNLQPYKDHSWYRFLRRLGVNEEPQAADLVTAVKRIAESGPPSKERIDDIRRIYQYLLEYVGEGKRYSSENPELKRLRDLAWLPSSVSQSQWHPPGKIYPGSMTKLIENQGQLLTLGEPTQQVRALLGIPSKPPTDLVIKHLLAASTANESIAGDVYVFLAREASDAQIQQLKQQRVICDSNRKTYWLPKHVFFTDQSALFGPRRGYLKPPGGDAQDLLEKLGVRSTPAENGVDFVEILREIANEYTSIDGVPKPIGETDRRLLLLYYDRLGDLLQDRLNQTNFQDLCEYPIVLGSDGRLHKPKRIVYADQKSLLDFFPTGAVPTVNEEKLSENALRFLRRLGVRPLSRLLKRTPVDTANSKEEQGFSLKIQGLVPAFQRIALTLQESLSQAEFDDLADKLKQVKLRTCERLIVHYQVDDGNGWSISGNRQPAHALYYAEKNFLYTCPDDYNSDSPHLPLAKELESVLFPGQKASIVIEQLLTMPPAQVERFLDRHGYRRLHQQTVEMPAATNETEMADLGDMSQAAFDWESQPAPEDEPSTEKITPHPSSAKQSELWSPVIILSTELLEDMAGNGSGLPFVEDQVESVETATSAEKGTEAKKPVDSPPRVPTSAATDESDPVVKVQTPEVAHEAEIPIFTGQLRPTVPVLPNNYGELQQKFGLTRFGKYSEEVVAIASAEGVAADAKWQPNASDNGSTEPGKDRRRTSARFTLTFQNRYEGVLPLHRTALEMLEDRPRELLCQTDDPDCSFSLYADYNQGILYNQTELPRLFDARAIPAGGIIYLERVHGTTVRLFWKQMDQRVEKVRCLELLEDGTIDEFEIDAVDVPCEISEYVFRAEKRLEDSDALFRQAIGKRGIFQTICEVFGAPNVELSWNEIFNGVMAVRQVASVSIEQELQKRACFVEVDNGRWRFDPSQGSEPRSASPIQAEKPIGSAEKLDPKPSIPNVTTPELSIYARLLTRYQDRWKTMSKIFSAPSVSIERFQQFVNELEKLFRGLQSDHATLSEDVGSIDPALQTVWGKVVASPQDQTLIQDFSKYLQEALNHKEGLNVQQLQRHLTETAPELCEHIFFPELASLAHRAAEQNQSEVAQKLYQLLQDRGAGDFSRDLNKFAENKDVQSYIQLAKESDTVQGQWQMWQEAWMEYPGHAALREEICQKVRTSFKALWLEVKDLLREKPVNAAIQLNEWFSLVYPLIDAWHAVPGVEEIWKVTVAVYKRLSDNLSNPANQEDVAREMLILCAKLPQEQYSKLSLHSLLNATHILAEEFARQNEIIYATALLEYVLHMIEREKQTVDSEQLLLVHLYLAELYQRIERHDSAYDHLYTAHRKSEGQSKQEIGNRLHLLRAKKEFVKSQAVEDWLKKSRQMLEFDGYVDLVNPDLYKEYLSKLSQKQ